MATRDDRTRTPRRPERSELRQPVVRLPKQRQRRQHRAIRLVLEHLEQHRGRRDELRRCAHDVRRELERLPHHRLAPHVIRRVAHLPLHGRLRVRRQVESRPRVERVQRVPPPDARVQRGLDALADAVEHHLCEAAPDAACADLE